MFKRPVIISASALALGAAISLGVKADDQSTNAPATSTVSTNQVKPSAALPVSEEKYEEAKRQAKFFGIDPRVIGPTEENKNTGAPAQGTSGSGTNKVEAKPQTATP